MGKTVWHGIKRFFHGLGLVQNFVLLAIFYFLLFGPFALIIRLTGCDLLGLRHGDRESFWRPRPQIKPSLERARHQS